MKNEIEREIKIPIYHGKRSAKVAPAPDIIPKNIQTPIGTKLFTIEKPKRNAEKMDRVTEITL